MDTQQRTMLSHWWTHLLNSLPPLLSTHFTVLHPSLPLFTPFSLVKAICCRWPLNEPLSRITVKICVFCGPFNTFLSLPTLSLSLSCSTPIMCVGHCCWRLYLAVIIIKMSKIISAENIDERLKCSINARNALNDSASRKAGRGVGVKECGGGGNSNSMLVGWWRCQPRGGN